MLKYKIPQIVTLTPEDGSKTYQVVLTDKEGTENTVFFNEKGEILK